MKTKTCPMCKCEQFYFANTNQGGIALGHTELILVLRVVCLDCGFVTSSVDHPGLIAIRQPPDLRFIVLDSFAEVSHNPSTFLKDYAMSRSARDAARSLRAISQEQGWYFTAKQASRLGYDYPHLAYHVSTGAFVRVDHGLYRLAAMPRPENEEFIRLSFWSRNRSDQPQAVVSHESALVLHDLTDLLPGRIDLTVPPGFRKVPPTGCVLHRAVLSEADVEDRIGFKTTTPLRTLLDVAAGTTSQEQLEIAAREALERGLVRKSKLVAAVRQRNESQRLERALGTSR